MKQVASTPTWLLHPPRQKEELPTWLQALRQQHWDALVQQGLPTRGNEHWKYTDLSCLTQHSFTPSQPLPLETPRYQAMIASHRLPGSETILLVFVNGHFMPTLSDLDRLPPSVTVCGLNEIVQKDPDRLKPYWSAALDVKKYPFAF